MQLKAKVFFFPFIFAAFLAVPVVVNLLTDTGKTVSVALTEEENTKNFKIELQKDFRLDRNVFSFPPTEISSSKQSYCNYILTAYSIYLDPVSPPPRQA